MNLSFFLFPTGFLKCRSKYRSSLAILFSFLLWAITMSQTAYAGWRQFGFVYYNITSPTDYQAGCEANVYHYHRGLIESFYGVSWPMPVKGELGGFLAGSNRSLYIAKCMVFLGAGGATPCPLGQVLGEGSQCDTIPIDPHENYGDNDNNTCNPMNIASGNKFFKQNDYVGAGVNPLRYDYYYNANRAQQKWTYNYRQALQILDDTIQVHRPDGQVIMVPLNDSGEPVMPSQRHEQLRKIADGYELRLANNAFETYNEDGQLLSIQFSSGIVHQLKYLTISGTSAAIEVTRLEDTLTLYVERLGVGASIQKVRLPDGTEIDYTFEQFDNYFVNLNTVTYADNTTRTYLYENTAYPHYVTGIINENGHRIASVRYDDQGRAISSERGELDSGIERTQIEYHDDGRRTLTNALGKQNIYHFTQFNGEYKMTQVEGLPSQNCASANQQYTYDDKGFMASKSDWKGNITTYTHNDRGLESSRTEASGTPQARTVETEWHDTFNLRTKITRSDTVTVLSYDNNGRLLSTEVSPR